MMVNVRSKRRTLDRMWLLVLALHFCIVTRTWADDSMNSIGNQFFLEEPRETTAQAGKNLVLPCKVMNQKGLCQWTKDGLGLGEDSDLPAHPRYHMEDCNLHIYPLLVEDEAKYQCQVGPGEKRTEKLQSRFAQITVQAEPSVPHIQQARLGDVLVVEQAPDYEPKSLELHCESLGARPAATITWRRDDGGEEVESRSEVTRMEDTGTFRTVSTINVMPEKNMNISCKASNELVPAGKTSNALKIRIQKVEEVELELSSSKPLEGESLLVVCKTSENFTPHMESPLHYAWYLGGEEVLNTGTDPEVLRIPVDKEMNGAEVACVVTNSVGKSQPATQTMNVLYGPTISEKPRPRTRYAIEGEEATFTCQANSNPAPVLVWVNKKSGEMNFGPHLTLTVSEETSGSDWICRAHTEGFPAVDSSPVQVQLVLPPSILRLEQSRVGPGELMVTCVAESVAPETEIVWRRDNQLVDISDPSIKTVQHKDKNTHHSYLILSQAAEKSSFSCHVSNQAGIVHRATASQFSSQEVNYLLVVLLPGLLVAAVLTTLLTCFCCMLHQRYAASTLTMEVEKRRNRKIDEVEACLEQPSQATANRTFMFDEHTLSASPSCASFNTTTSTLPSITFSSP